MAAPAFGAAGTILAAADAATAAVPVPAGVTAGQIILVNLNKENSAVVTPPAGFAEVATAVAVTTGGQVQWHYLFWKRASGADAGTYSFTWTGTIWRSARAVRYTGCVASGSPVDVVGTNFTATAVTTTPAVSVTTTGPERLLVWSAGGNADDGTWTPPSGYTERVDQPMFGVATLDQAAAGSSGSITGASSGSASKTVWLIGLLPVATDVSPRPPVVVGSAVGRAGSW